MPEKIPTIAKRERIASIDVLRGIVMIIMALDHVRDFFHAPAATFDPLDFAHTTVATFLTRWITHFCAPVFVFLSGTSAYLTLERKGKKGLSKFLLSRGLWLVIIELTVINFTMNLLQVTSVLLLETIWALGISMIALSALIYLPKRILLLVALVIIFGHNALDSVSVEGNGMGALLWAILHQTRLFSFGKFNLITGYPVLPWIGVMAAGYCFGELFKKYDPAQRRKYFAFIGVCCLIAFVAIRFINIYGDFQPWSHQKSAAFTILSFIKTTKYPPSLLFILMTLGAAILLLSLVERPLNKFTKIASVYGRVPLFYFVVHLYFIRIAYTLIACAKGYDWHSVLNKNILAQLPGFGFTLPIVYLIWLIIVSLLFPLCKSYDKYKTANKDKWWLSYL